MCMDLGVSCITEPLILPPEVSRGSDTEKLAFINSISKTVVDGCFTNDDVADSEDGVYSYTRILCHYGSLVMEFWDAWHEGEGERALHCWKLFMPHFKAAGFTKFALEALKLQNQTGLTYSPNLAHQVTWDQFVEKQVTTFLVTCSMSKLLKHIIQNMGSNLTESALQRAARSVTSLQQICESFYSKSGMP